MQFSRLKELIISIILFFTLWHILSLVINSPLPPDPFSIILVFSELISGIEIWAHILASLERTLLGFFLAVIVGSSLAYLLAFSPRIKRYVSPWIELLRSVPPLAWIPLAILWFGIGLGSAVFIIFLFAFFPMFTEVYFGIKSIPILYSRLSEIHQLSGFQRFIHITFPYTLPYLFSGLKIGIGLAWMSVIAAEMVSANEGLGYFIEISRVTLQIEQIIAVMMIIGIIGYLMHHIMCHLEKRLTSWRY